MGDSELGTGKTQKKQLAPSSTALPPTLKQLGIVNTLRPTNNLLPTDEDVKGVGQFWVVRARHGIEGSHTKGVPASKDGTSQSSAEA